MGKNTNKWSAWVSLNVTVAATMTDLDYMYSQVPLLFGTPQQSMDVTINLSGDLLSAWSEDCIFCQGEESFDKTLSSTIKVGRMSCFAT